MIVGGVTMITQQIASDAPGVAPHNAHLVECHSPEIVMRNDRKVYEVWKIRRKADV